MMKISTTVNAKTGDVSEDVEQISEDVALEVERKRMKCSRFQAKAALLDAGLLDDAQAAVDASDATTQLAWAEASEFHRTSPTIAAIAAAINLTDVQTDDLFRSAMNIEV